MSITEVVRCADGTEIPFEWVYDSAPRVPWLLNDSHHVEPLSPMELWFYQAGEPGIDRAWAEAELEPMSIFYRFQHAGPFQYTRLGPWNPGRESLVADRVAELLDRHGTIASFWRDFSEPRIRAAIDYIRATPTNTPLGEIAERWAHGWWQTFIAMAPILVLRPRLGALLARQFGQQEATLLADEVIQGGTNASQVIDGEVEEVARLARSSSEILDALEGGTMGRALQQLRELPSAAAFVSAFDALIERHADRSFRWDMMAPTWQEDPAGVLALVAAQAKSPRDAAGSAAASLARRDGARERVLEALPPAEREEFEELIRVFEDYVSVREGRAYWQMTLTGATRLHLLRRGAELVDGGHLRTAEDVLFVTPPEIQPEVAPDLAHRVDERREEWQRWAKVKPPTIIGRALEMPGAAAREGELHGVAVSRGTISGRARILRGPEDGAFMEDGDIVVCLMTTPAWTPVLATAGAIVTETGSPSSHPAIVAREYGIPCVVGVRGATTAISEGAMIEVDGTNGVVRVLE